MEAVAAAAPAAEDPSPEVMVMVNDCHLQHSSLNIPRWHRSPNTDGR